MTSSIAFRLTIPVSKPRSGDPTRKRKISGVGYKRYSRQPFPKVTKKCSDFWLCIVLAWTGCPQVYPSAIDSVRCA